MKGEKTKHFDTGCDTAFHLIKGKNINMAKKTIITKKTMTTKEMMLEIEALRKSVQAGKEILKAKDAEIAIVKKSRDARNSKTVKTPVLHILRASIALRSKNQTSHIDTTDIIKSILSGSKESDTFDMFVNVIGKNGIRGTTGHNSFSNVVKPSRDTKSRIVLYNSFSATLEMVKKAFSQNKDIELHVEELKKSLAESGDISQELLKIEADKKKALAGSK